MNFGDKVTIVMQGVLSILFFCGYFFVIWLFATGRINVPVDFKETFSGIIGGITSTLGVVVFFWFNRSRAPSATTT
jgi:hypothetical protein